MDPHFMKNIFLNLPRVQKQLIAAGADVICLPLIFYCAIILHFERISGLHLEQYLWIAAGAGIISVPVYVNLGL